MGKVTCEETPSHVRRDLVRRALSRMQVFLQAAFPSCSLFLSPNPSIPLPALYRTPVYVIALNYLWFTLLHLLLIHNDHPTHPLQAGTKSHHVTVQQNAFPARCESIANSTGSSRLLPL